ncbi:hypothetical protein BpHYR1_053997 [Brachionus plicatilis]|uniref:Uncharacterized protein n=1 Tax=Brachionus plicatilis TaxID=10195 RepID=A0A3M7S5M3_BRAPC|nr:hypothetical protein BpHYR1_053997 [Brachionus plicatilis]
MIKNHFCIFNTGPKIMSTFIPYPTIPGALLLFPKEHQKWCKFIMISDEIKDYTHGDFSDVNKKYYVAVQKS